MMFMYTTGCRVLFFLLFFFPQLSLEGLIKVDAANNVVGGSDSFAAKGKTRPIEVKDLAEAIVDAKDLLSVLRGIAKSLDCTGGDGSWLHLPRTKVGSAEDLETHLLRGHGPAGGISQAHIMSDSIFSSQEVAGIVAPEKGVGLAIDPGMPLSAGGRFGNEGKPMPHNRDQKDVNSVNVPVRNTVISILEVIRNGGYVYFQVAPIRGMRKFIIDIRQASLANCPRPIIYDDQTAIPPTPFRSEGWFRKNGGESWRISQRPGSIVIRFC